MSDPTTSELIERINAALSDEHALTGIACKHGWDLAVCVMAECENPYALEPLLNLAASRLADLERDYNMLSAEYADLKAFDTEEMGALLSRATTAERSLARAEEVIEPFARYALGDDADMIPDECVISLTYDSTDFDEELGGPNTLLGEPFMRVFRLARDFLNRSKDTGGEHGDAPRRIQLSRAKGWRMPENTVKVDRSTKWGNPFVPGKSGGFYTGGRPVQDRRHAWRLYQAVAPDNEALVAAARAELRGKNLACWCPHDDPYQDVCHAAVLLEIANADTGGQKP